jgi:hypothetical protein
VRGPSQHRPFFLLLPFARWRSHDERGDVALFDPDKRRVKLAHLDGDILTFFGP